MVLDHQHESHHNYGADRFFRGGAKGPSSRKGQQQHHKSSSMLNFVAGPNGNGQMLSSAASSTALNNSHNHQQQHQQPALPRLASALKSLISSAGINGSFKTSKCAFVDAGDEVIFYSNALPHQGAEKSSQRSGGANAATSRTSEEGGNVKWSPSLTRVSVLSSRSPDESAEQFSASSSSHYFSHRQPTTLEQIRQLYKSVPNFSSFDDGNDDDQAGFGPLDEAEEQKVQRGQAVAASSSRLGRLCPTAMDRNGGNCCPPPLQPQRRRLPTTAVINGGGPSQQQQKQGEKPGPSACSSAASSLASSNSARSLPPENGVGGGKWSVGPSAALDEQVGEQCEKLVLTPSLVNAASKANMNNNNSPPGSLASCSLGSGGSASSSSGRSNHPSTSGAKSTAVMTNKCSPTDSGYRSRGETPKGQSQHRTRPVSMMCSGRELMMEQQQQPLLLSPFSPTVPTIIPERPLPTTTTRNYAWTEPVVQEEVDKWPFTETQLAELVSEELALSEGTERRTITEQMPGDIGTWLYQSLGQLLGQFWRELRRLSSVLAKCTLRDCGLATLLLLPSGIAWDCLRYAATASDHFSKWGASADQQPTTTPALRPRLPALSSLSSRARIQHLDAGHFLRWMLDSRVAVIAEPEVAVFLTAIFDSLVGQFLKMLKRDQQQTRSAGHWTSANSFVLNDQSSPLTGLLSMLRQNRPFSKQYRLLLGSDHHQYYSPAALAEQLHNVPLSKLVFPGESPALEAQLFGTTIGSHQQQLTISEEAMTALHFWLNLNCEKQSSNGEEEEGNKAELLEQWLAKAAMFALHRRSDRVVETDFLQAARLLLPEFDCPPPTAGQFHLDSLVGSCPLTRAILLGRSGGGSQWEEANKTTTNFTQLSNGQSTAADEFAGWTALCWAIAVGNEELVEQLLISKPWAAKEARNNGLPLKICAQTGNLAIAEQLLRHGANPFKAASSPGGPSPFALSAARNDLAMLRLFLASCSLIRRSSGQQLLLLTANNNNAREEGDSSSADTVAASSSLGQLLGMAKFGALTGSEKTAFEETIYMAAETGRHQLALQLRAFGVPWPSATAWLNCLEWAVTSEEGQMEEKRLAKLLDDFGPKMGEELLVAAGASKRAQLLADLLFRLLSSSSSSSSIAYSSSSTVVERSAARVLSEQFQRIQKSSLSQLEREFAVYFPGHGQQQQQDLPQIDPKFVDCSDLSDIRFRFDDGQIVFGHRIVLVNASEQFRHMLRSPCGVVDVPGACADSFRLLLEFTYGNVAKCAAQVAKAGAERQKELIRLAERFGLAKLVETAQKVAGAELNTQSFVAMYKFAQERKLVQLAEDCERFALAHLPELLDNIIFPLTGRTEAFFSKEQRTELFHRLKAQFQLAVHESRI